MGDGRLGFDDMDKLKIPFRGWAYVTGGHAALIPPGPGRLFSQHICQEREVPFLIAAGGNSTVDGLINVLVAATISMSDLKKFLKS